MNNITVYFLLANNWKIVTLWLITVSAMGTPFICGIFEKYVIETLMSMVFGTEVLAFKVLHSIVNENFRYQIAQILILSYCYPKSRCTICQFQAISAMNKVCQLTLSSSHRKNLYESTVIRTAQNVNHSKPLEPLIDKIVISFDYPLLIFMHVTNPYIL